MMLYFSACDVTVANSNHKNFLYFLTCTCAPHFEKGFATHAHTSNADPSGPLFKNTDPSFHLKMYFSDNNHFLFVFKENVNRKLCTKKKWKMWEPSGIPWTVIANTISCSVLTRPKPCKRKKDKIKMSNMLTTATWVCDVVFHHHTIFINLTIKLRIGGAWNNR